MAEKGKGKAGQSQADWLERSAARFREGRVRDPRSLVGPASGIWEDPDDGAGVYVAQSILRPKSAAKAKSQTRVDPGHERVAVPPEGHATYHRAPKYHKGDAKGSAKGKGKTKEKPRQQLDDKTIKQMRFENTTSLTFNPTRWVHMILGRPVVVFHVLWQFRSCIRTKVLQSPVSKAEVSET